ncbi:hypothetical protein SDC9_88682 [bioreactor metagenome]|uniref:Uncharacterized protein n=1 Tax=bioreactor metagenome TaxID=1076179 RepID=A0A644ZM63_9ZZZZ
MHLPGGRADLVEEPPIVGDDQQAAGVRGPAALEMRGQPGDRLEVEVVGRLIEGQHVPVAGEQLGQRDPSALTAGQGVEAGVPVQVGHHPGDDVADPRVAGPGVLRRVTDHGVPDRLLIRQGVGLVQHADPDAVADGHPAPVGRTPPGEHGEQAGLAVAVAADDADPIALVHPEGDGVEDQLGRIFQVEALGPEQMRHSHSRVVSGRHRCPSGPVRSYGARSYGARSSACPAGAVRRASTGRSGDAGSKDAGQASARSVGAGGLSGRAVRACCPSPGGRWWASAPSASAPGDGRRRGPSPAR